MNHTQETVFVVMAYEADRGHNHPHDWQEVVRHDGERGFYCKHCDWFVGFNSTRPCHGCVPHEDNEHT